MKIPRIMIAAPKSGSGKTMITCALLQALRDSGEQVFACKCGPDYIDPMFHKKVLGVASGNLDTFFTDERATRVLLQKGKGENSLVVMEGVMGLFDGLGGIREEGSSYHLAKVTGTPIILVVDAKGMGRSVLPLIAGFLQYDSEHLIQGVILNRMSKSYYETIKPLIAQELGITVLGYFPEEKGLHIESRHLGLKLPHEIENLKEQVKEAAEKLADTIDIENIQKIAGKAEDLKEETYLQSQPITEEKPVIAVAMDEAFCFYYEENLAFLSQLGAELVFFSPLHDKKLPKGCHGILLGGGYPELVAESLSRNQSMLVSIRQAINKGMPSVAECGGFMYLHEAIIGCDGTEYPMAGVIPAACKNTGKLVRFGYIELTEKNQVFWTDKMCIKGHEFHYYDSTQNGEACMARKPVTGKEYPCVIRGKNHWWGFPHLYYPSNPAFARHFIEEAMKYKKREEE